VPNRDIGAQLYGTLGEGIADYAIGVFDGTPDSGFVDGDQNDSKDVAGRLFLRPFRALDLPALRDFGAGFAASAGDRSGSPNATNLAVYKTTSQLTFFSYRADPTMPDKTVLPNGSHVRLSPQGYFYAGRFGLLGEYVLSSMDLKIGTTAKEIDNSAWQVAASVVLFGGRPSYDGIQGLAPISLADGHYGALELAARYNEEHVQRGAFPVFADPAKSARDVFAFDIGLNWYFNRGVKLNFDVGHAEFNGGGAPNRPDETTIFTRLQIAF
jgi:phosphate-selective porin OprO/OprP